MLLAGDIGGTKTSLALISKEAGPKAPVAEATFPSAEYPDLKTIVATFLQRFPHSPERATFGVAGPVVAGKADITNLPWVVDREILETKFSLKSVHLLNDLEAVAYSVTLLENDDIFTLNSGAPQPQRSIAVIAPGTGLGEAFLTWNGHRYQAHASEGSHNSFAPTNEAELGLLRFLFQEHRHVSFERVCSGMGIPNIYAYLKTTGLEEPAWLRAKLDSVKDPTPVIANAALDVAKPCQLCRATMEMFTAILGAEAGNMVLSVMATGGVYIGGGIPPRILPLLQEGHFMSGFCNKGRFRNMNEKVPVHVILNPKAALWGAAAHVLTV